MVRALASLWQNRDGTAAAEMALVTPILLALTFSVFEIGNYFYSEHVVAKAVRDGARFASRSFALNADCATPPASVVTATQTVTRTGQVSGGTTRLAGWTNDATVTVALACDTSANPYVANGIFKGQTGGVRVVTVTAAVPYTSLFGILGLAQGNALTLNAQSQAPVMGI
jgi:Flp pilus assembly protein TadG